MSNDEGLVPELIWVNGQTGAGIPWSLRQSTLIGREHADINIPVSAVSRRHAMVSVKVGYCTIEDLGSRNGTAVNGSMLPVGVAQPLRDGDVILLAGMAELTFKDPMATPIAPRIGKLRGLWIDEESSEVWLDAQKVQPALSGKQYDLLCLLYRANGKVVSREEIVANVWSYASPEGISNDAVDSLIKRLRRRLVEYSSDTVIEQIREKGIRLVDS